jgi:DNA-binding PadR family transcriptional regulator
MALLSKIDPRNALFVFEVLYLIKMGSKSGYQVQKAFKDLLGLKVSFGLLYPTLHILLKQGYLTCDTSYSSERFPRKVYSITEKGLEAIENNIKFMKYFVTDGVTPKSVRERIPNPEPEVATIQNVSNDSALELVAVTAAATTTEATSSSLPFSSLTKQIYTVKKKIKQPVTKQKDLLE